MLDMSTFDEKLKIRTLVDDAAISGKPKVFKFSCCENTWFSKATEHQKKKICAGFWKALLNFTNEFLLTVRA
jgi:hypothetical protein